MYKVDKESTNKNHILEKCNTTNPETAAQGAVIYRPAPGPLHPLQLQQVFGVFRPHLSNLFSDEIVFHLSRLPDVDVVSLQTTGHVV